jgi:hypothetical protein
MFRFNGIGTTIYGKRDLNPADGSYIVTKWFTFVYFPVIPLGSYRVIKEKQNFLTDAKYYMNEAPFNTRQVLLTYLAWWGLPGACVLLGIIGTIAE